MFCGYCGAKIEDGQKFCPECGKPVKQDNSPEPAQTNTVTPKENVVMNQEQTSQNIGVSQSASGQSQSMQQRTSSTNQQNNAAPQAKKGMPTAVKVILIVLAVIVVGFIGLVIWGMSLIKDDQSKADQQESTIAAESDKKQNSIEENVKEEKNEKPKTDDTDKKEANEAENSNGAEMMPAVDEQVIYDDKDLKITASYLRIDTQNGNVLISLDLENNSKENVLMTANKIYVDGTLVDGAAYCSADKGETGSGDVAINGDSLKENKVDEFFKKVEFEMDVANSDYEDLFKTEKLTINVTKGEVYSDETELPEESDESDSVGEGPKPDDIQWIVDYIETSGQNMLDKGVKSLKEEDCAGKWNAYFIVYDDEGVNEEFRQYMTADVESDKKGISITLHPLYKYDPKTKEKTDISDQPDMKFSGKWNEEGDYTATGDGKLDMVIFDAGGRQYSFGAFTYPSGEAAVAGLDRN